LLATNLNNTMTTQQQPTNPITLSREEREALSLLVESKSLKQWDIILVSRALAAITARLDDAALPPVNQP